MTASSCGSPRHDARVTFVPGLDGSAFGKPDDHVLLVAPGSQVGVPPLTLADVEDLAPDRKHFLGSLDGAGVWAVDVAADTDVGDEVALMPLIMAHSRLGNQWWAIAGRAVQISAWWHSHQYCGTCGKPTAPRDAERALGCGDCNTLHYPRIAPAVIVLIHRDDEVLLARGRSFGAPMYSTLAGFVEPGENLEQTIRREVREEVGVEVDEIVYRASQSWPFPHSLMLGFTARWSSGDIQIDESEIVDAQWFKVDSLPNIPPPFAISRWLIDGHIERLDTR